MTSDTKTLSFLTRRIQSLEKKVTTLEEVLLTNQGLASAAVAALQTIASNQAEFRKYHAELRSVINPETIDVELSIRPGGETI